MPQVQPQFPQHFLWMIGDHGLQRTMTIMKVTMKYVQSRGTVTISKKSYKEL